jgi:hypothetical protein
MVREGDWAQMDKLHHKESYQSDCDKKQLYYMYDKLRHFLCIHLFLFIYGRVNDAADCNAPE